MLQSEIFPVYKYSWERQHDKGTAQEPGALHCTVQVRTDTLSVVTAVKPLDMQVEVEFEMQDVRHPHIYGLLVLHFSVSQRKGFRAGRVRGQS